MTNLTETTYYTRKILKYGSIAIITIIILRLALKTAFKIYHQINPPAPPAPTVSFGRLPKIQFPQPKETPPQLTYQLETIQGNLPKLKTIARVYLMPQKGAGLLDLSRATTQAQKLGFTGQPKALSQTSYQWQSFNLPQTSLEIETTTSNFHLAVDYRNDAEILMTKNLPTDQQALQEARNLLMSANLLPTDFATGSANFQYFRFSYPDLTSTISLSEANFIKVNLLRDDLDNLKVLPPNPYDSLINFLFSGARSTNKRIIEINYRYFPVEKEIYGTYPLKPVDQAWSELQSNQGWMANLGENQSGQITIRQVYLAYYDSPTAQNYLQPIYVFEGDRNFLVYIPAIDPKWTE